MADEILRVAIIATYPAAALLPPSHVRSRFLNAGAEHPAPWLRSLCRSLASRDDIDARVFIDSRAVRSEHTTELEGIQVVFTPRREPLRCSPYDGYLPAMLRVRPHMKRFRPHVVHGFGTQGQNGMIAVSQRTPSIVSIQGIVAKLSPWTTWSGPRRGLETLIERHVVRRASTLIAKTEFARLWALGISPTARIVTIPNAMNTEFLQVTPRHSSDVILCIGSLEPWKGSDTVLRALAECRGGREVRLVFIGTGSMLDTCRRAARQMGVEQRVTFAGACDHRTIMQYMSDARMVVLGSRMDTSPNVVAEAHAAALPVVATRAGGIPDMIRDGEDGFLVPVDDAAQMATCMARLLDDERLARRLGFAGREKVRVVHEPARVAAMHAELYATFRRM